MAMGVARVVIGTRALQPDGADFLRRLIGWYGADHIVVALDEREGLVALHGWQAVSTMPVLEAAKRVQAAGVARIVYTDTARDGMLSGVNPEPIYRLAMETGLAIIAAGGISSLADIRTLMSIPGVEAAIIGKALYTGDILLSAALAMVRETPC
jgi:phosphoribosylformimino-5-aminoimidazole carboxamide ribotide isomerase